MTKEQIKARVMLTGPKLAAWLNKELADLDYEDELQVIIHIMGAISSRAVQALEESRRGN